MSLPFRVNNLVREVLELLRPQNVFKRVLKLYHNELRIEGSSFQISHKLHLVAVGKAASFELAAVKEIVDNSQVDYQLGTCVAYTKRNHLVSTNEFIQLEGDHPLVSQDNLDNTSRLIEILKQVDEEDSVLFLLSGGASALLELPREQLSFEKLQDIHEDLLASGKNINEMNEIRKALSMVKNGGLLKYINSKQIIQLVTCDIPNENMADVGSGPLIYTQLNYASINEYLSKFSLRLEDMGAPLVQAHSFITQSASTLLKHFAGDNKYIIGKVYDELCDSMIEDLMGQLPAKGQVLVTAGEATIELPANPGKGGRNTHFVLEMAQRLYENKENRDIRILSFGTDGTDGPTDAAGAYINYELMQKLPIDSYLAQFNSYEYFDKVGTLVKTGPTQNNLMDIRFLWRE